MNGYQKLKRQLLPLLKGIPFIAGLFFLFLFIAKTMIKYTPNTYQTIAKIKLDDQKFDVSNNYLYKDFEIFSVEHKIDAKVELLKSPIIVEKALRDLHLNARISRVGTFKNLELYKDDCPFLIETIIPVEKHQNQTFALHISANGKLQITKGSKKINGYLGKALTVEGGTITIFKNKPLLQQVKLDLAGDYEVRLFSKEALIRFVSENLDVTAADKETPILRVVYKDKHPQKTADITNRICEAYIEDYIKTKSGAAQKTVDFIDEKLQTISGELSHSEETLKTFKENNDVVNTLQETETGLREISKLKVELINLEMNEQALRDLNNGNNIFSQPNPQAVSLTPIGR